MRRFSVRRADSSASAFSTYCRSVTNQPLPFAERLKMAVWGSFEESVVAIDAHQCFHDEDDEA